MKSHRLEKNDIQYIRGETMVEHFTVEIGQCYESESVCLSKELVYQDSTKTIIITWN